MKTEVSKPQQQVQKFSNTIDDMVNILNHTIKEVQKNPKYIPQAVQINKSCTQIILARKLQVEVARVVLSAENKKGKPDQKAIGE